MSRLAVEWIQRSFSVPKIGSIERDLADGYILLKILTQMGYVTDEEVEVLPQRSANPSVILDNFKLLTKFIKRININLTKRMVTQIMAEESGIAAELIMKMKRGMETMNNPKANLEPEYKKSLKSLRPRKFERYDYYKDVVDTPTSELFYRDATSTLYNGIFNEIDMRCQLGEYEEYKYDVDKNAIREEQKDRELELERKQKTHKEINEFERTIREKNITTAAEVTDKWKKSLKPGEARHIRDLQFELATLKVRELKENRQRNIHRTEEVNGINEFEFNLTRLGIGGGEENTNLTTTYESASSFLDRIEEMTMKNLPSNAVIQDFVTQLKVRTKEKKLARYDKARRRRRMLVDQANAQTEANSRGAVSDSQTLGAYENSVLLNEKMIKLKLKEERDNTAISANIENSKRIKEEAEESVRLFAEQFRMIADESSDERLQHVRVLQESIAQKKARKHEGIHNFCREVVVEMIANMFDAISTEPFDSRNRYSTIPFATEGCVELLDKLLQHLDNVVGNTGDVDDLCITMLDSWPAFAALALNLNKWKANTVFTTVQIVAAATEPIVDVESTEAPAEAITNILPTETVSSIELTKSMSFIESTHQVIEDILSNGKKNSTNESGSTQVFNENLSLSSDEIIQLNEKITGNVCKVLYVMNTAGGWTNPHYCYTQLSHWLNQHQSTIALWDSICAYEAGIKIKPLLDGKVPAINFQSLVKIFGRSTYINESGTSFAIEEEVEVPDAVLGTALPPKILALLKEMVDIVNRINAIKDSFISNINDISPTFNHQFTETTLAILLGQSLFVRNFIRDVYIAANVTAIIPPIVIVSNAITSDIPVVGPFDNPSGCIEVLDWFLRGGTKDNAPEHLAALIAEESGVSAPAAGKKKAPAKGAAEEEVPCCSYITGIIVVKSISVAEDSSAMSLESPLAIASTGYLLLQSYLRRKRGNLLANSADDSAVLSLVQKENYMSGTTRLYVLNNEENSTDIKYASVDIAVAELMLCCVLDACQPIIDGVSSAPRVNNILSFRRNNNLSPVNKLLLLHDLGTNPLNLLSLYDLHAVLCRAQAEEIEIKGSLMVLLTTQLKIIENGISNREEILVSSIKKAEERYKQLCMSTISEINKANLTDTDVKHKLMDLVCNIGDIIDRKHRQWLQLTSDLIKAASNELFAAQILMLKLIEVTGEVTFKVLESHKNAGLQLASLLEMAGYDEFPWLVDATGTNRLLVDAKRDELRAVINTVCQDIEQLYVNSDASELRVMHQETESASDKSVVWTSLASLPTTAADVNAVRSTIISSVYKDTLEFAVTWNSTIHLMLQDIISNVNASNERLKKYVVSRHGYEHRVLSQWSKELLSFNLNDVVSISDFLKVSSFIVSYDHKVDGIRAISKGNNLINLSDMRLPLVMISELSQEMCLRLDGDNDAHNAPSLSTTIMDIIKLKIEQSEDYYKMTPMVWRDSVKVEQFVASILRRSVTSSDCDTRRNFQKLFILTLVAGLIPALPNKSYLLRIGKILSPATLEDLPLSFQQQPTFPIDLFLAKLLDDKFIKKGWYSSSNSSDLKLLFTAVANCCRVKSTKDVLVEEFLLMLCSDITDIESKLLENSMSLMRINGNDDDPNAINISNKPSKMVLTAMPLFVNNGLCKLAYLAAHMRLDEPAPLNAGVVSKDYTRFKEVMGDHKLSVKQLEWLVSKLGCEDVCSVSARIMTDKSHRIFGLSNDTGRNNLFPQEIIGKNSEVYISELLQDTYIGSKSVQEKLLLSRGPTQEGLTI